MTELWKMTKIYMASLLSTAVAFQLNPNNTTKLKHCHETATCFLSAGKEGDWFWYYRLFGVG